MDEENNSILKEKGSYYSTDLLFQNIDPVTPDILDFFLNAVPSPGCLLHLVFLIPYDTAVHMIINDQSASLSDLQTKIYIIECNGQFLGKSTNFLKSCFFIIMHAAVTALMS